MSKPKAEAFTHPRQSFSCGLCKKSIEIVSFFKMYQIDIHQPLTVVLGYERTLIIKTSFFFVDNIQCHKSIDKREAADALLNR